MKRTGPIFFTALFLLAAAQNSVAQTHNAKELPWYFPEGVITTNDPPKQFAEFIRYFGAQMLCFQGREEGVQTMIPGRESIRIETDIVSTSGTAKEKSNMVIILDHYVRMKDILSPDDPRYAELKDKIRVTTLCDQRFVSERELQIVIADLIQQTKVARSNSIAFWSKLTDIAVRARAKRLGVPEQEFAARLDGKIPGHDITYREYNYLPKPQKASDFVPRELHLGYSPRMTGVLGVTWLNTGVVYYNPQARVRDYLMGYPSVIQHEMVHANSNLQRYPFVNGFDPEILASIQEMLIPYNRTDLFFHSYSEPLREIIEIYFGFDFELVRKEIFRYDLAGQLVIDEEKFRSYFAELEGIKTELLSFFENVVLPEFYSEPLWWMAMNDRRRDDNSVIRVMMAVHYDPTSLGGREKTMLWLEKNRPIIERIARESFEEMRNRAYADPATIDAPASLVSIYKQFFTESEQKELEKYFREHPELLKELLGDPEKLVRFIEEFKAKRLKGGVK